MVEGLVVYFLKLNQKFLCGFGLNNVFVFYKGIDILKDLFGQIVISEVQLIYVFWQDWKDDVDWVVCMFGFDFSIVEVLQMFQFGYFVFKYGFVFEMYVQYV